MTISAICQNNLYADSGRMCYNYPHNLEECATTTRTIWKNVLQLHAQSGRMSIIGEGIELTQVVNYMLYYMLGAVAAFLAGIWVELTEIHKAMRESEEQTLVRDTETFTD